MEGGLVSQSTMGTPQGGPLSPLLSNILLDELDKELERREHNFCRYADDVNIYVGFRSAGERVLDSIEKFLTQRLRLQVNRQKSAVDRPWKRKFLGYSLTWHNRPRLKVAPSSLERLKKELKKPFDRDVKVRAHYPGRSVNLPCATGIARCWEGLAEVSRRHSRPTRPSRRPEPELPTGA
jgi:RNA-directed DNA polymerase